MKLTGFKSVLFAAVAAAGLAASAATLPLAYQEVEYIEASGVQCIDTGVLVNQNSSVECDVDAELTSNAKWAGSNGYMQYQANLGGGVRHVFRVVYAEKKENVFLDDSAESVYTKDWSNYSSPDVKLGVLRMGDKNNGWYSENQYQSGKLYSLKVFVSGELKINAIPCYERDGEKRVGLYDLQGRAFFPNAGAGAFAAGPDVCFGDRLVISGSSANYGEVSPAYGVTNGLAAGESFTCSAPANWTSDDGKTNATCVGYKVYVDDSVVQEGKNNSFTYTHPDSETGAKLVWQWEREFKVTASATEGGSVSIGEQMVKEGDVIEITASPNDGKLFVKWTGDVPDGQKRENPLKLKVEVAKTVTATFRTIGGESLTWTGAEGTDWNTPGNWSPAQTPMAGDEVTIPTEVTNWPEMPPTDWPEEGSYASLTVAAGAKIVCLGDKAADGLGRGPWITADEMLIDGTLDAVGQGYQATDSKGTNGGMGYGGNSAAHGGISAWQWHYRPWGSKFGGIAYGNCEAPTELGSSPQNANTPGGGAIRLVSSGTIIVNGRIDASAANKKGAASGGSVWIVCKTLAGSAEGVIAANACPTPSSAGGGGGRIALDYEIKTFAGSVQVKDTPGVPYYYYDGMPGTIYEPKRYPLGTPEEPAEITLGADHCTYVFPNDGKTRYWKLNLTGSNARVGFLRGKINLASLTVSGSGSALWFGRWGGSMEESCTVEGEALKNLSVANNTRLMLPGADKQRVWNFDSLSVASGSFLYFGGADLVNKQGTVINVSGDMSVAGGISLDRTGSNTKFGGDQGEAAYGGAHGGSTGYYTGWKADTHSDYYGSLSAPVTLGKTRRDLQDCGGALELNVAGTLTLDGTIQSVGADAGGAGGSIWAKLGRLSGTGSFNASAGTADSQQPGSGGRISIEVAEGENSVSATVAGGVDDAGYYYRIGYAGTVFRSQGPRIAALSSDYAVSGLSYENMPVNSNAEAKEAIKKSLRAYRVVSVNKPSSSNFAWTERFVLNTPDGEIAYPNTVTYTISDLAANTKYRVTHNGVARRVKTDAEGKLVFSAEFQNGLEPDSFVVDKTGLVIMFQ